VNCTGHDIILGFSVSGGLDETGHLYVCCPAVFSPDMGDDWTGAEYETREATENLWVSRDGPELSALLPFRAFDRGGDLMSLWPRAHAQFCRGKKCPHLTRKEWQSGKRLYCSLFKQQISKVRIEDCPVIE